MGVWPRKFHKIPIVDETFDKNVMLNAKRAMKPQNRVDSLFFYLEKGLFTKFLLQKGFLTQTRAQKGKGAIHRQPVLIYFTRSLYYLYSCLNFEPLYCVPPVLMSSYLSFLSGPCWLQRIHLRIISFASTYHKQARVLSPLMFMAQEPQIPSRHERLKVRVGSTSFFILMRASRTMGPHLE